MEEVEVREEKEDAKSVDFILDRKLARSLEVMRIRLSSDWACCAKAIAKVTSSAGVSEVIRRGCDSGDKVEEIGRWYIRMANCFVCNIDIGICKCNMYY